MIATQTQAAQALAAALAEFRAAAAKLAQLAEARYNAMGAAIDGIYWSAMELGPPDARKLERLEKDAEKVDEIAQVARDALSGLEVL